ncbi:excinuclease ABC subunit UvrC [Pseudoalteromonas luteoviolacea]|uniref:UvrABC system protein C n=1 Tax=Pseudoalteromonas luteoviolacea S4054 TaxID=1129367 RepID=A0A0F6AG26_9GAMM|nr:excinuclease ABC subunit UvrC [Pseudoalteromonas luteoviolacea]AOT09135.1 excinuclease ABC subunit C [Pseudoalteromonas luteoviolacea]AOT14048.1 excinuclease ABC subunit C [Pseudoalteromonas luteoviolacea]AOT18963.1 excinuclease ABC subunit C [Pseudoalteromonas luteoviolacea]KKE85165.1 excinuclease ABC subunit C [Pseudoalteromonas luteoviolacea S4054]KZN70283.1 excinuclease ABC subunit C [Pseudoalteromonas luteoviolacea S4047-1]
MAEFDHKSFLKTLSTEPGVYRMYDDEHQVIYVGKAKNLKKRVSSYFRKNIPDSKTRVLVSNIVNIEVTLTNTETEALLLENNLIKKYQPRYNILLRDDKSYPYILLTEHKHPRIAFHRGARKQKGEYYGPFPSSAAVSESLRLMQKIFPVRQCEDAYYRARSRPCLQHQLKRCSAPCVDKVTESEYAEQVELVRQFLGGKSHLVIEALVAKMESASMALNFEAAAKYRDQIALLRQMQEQQSVAGNFAEMDVIGFAQRNGLCAIHMLMIRDHKILGSKTYFPKVPKDSTEDEILTSFIGQYYVSNGSNARIASDIVLPFELSEHKELTEALTQLSKRKVHVRSNVRAERANYLALATKNALNSIMVKQSAQDAVSKRYALLKEAVGLVDIHRMECFDISHTMGENTVASCVVFDAQGPNTKEYRRYNVTGITPGDDYAAMDFALHKRYTKIVDESKVPDIIFIDGGKGQLARAEAFFENWKLDKMPMLIGVAKGTSRKPGLETLLFDGGRKTINLDSDSPALHLIQHIRDESHRFAIAGHRNKRQKQRTQSVLEEIGGVGNKRRQALLKYLGGLQGVKSANIQQLGQVPGISPQLAEKIFNHLHDKA